VGGHIEVSVGSMWWPLWNCLVSLRTGWSTINVMDRGRCSMAQCMSEYLDLVRCRDDV
jgi:hypothetical protein